MNRMKVAFRTNTSSQIGTAILCNAVSRYGAPCFFLTPAGIEEKTRITLAFFKRKQAKYEAIRLEIEALHLELVHAAH